MGAKIGASAPPARGGKLEGMNGVIELAPAHQGENPKTTRDETREAYPRYAKFVFVSDMNVLDGYLKVVHDFGDQRSYETLGLLGVICSMSRYVRSRE